jgi:hypothetical protein
VDVLVAATYSDDGSLGTACSSLAMRLREQNGVVSLPFSFGLRLHLGRVQSSLDTSSDDPVWIYRSAIRTPSEVAVAKATESWGPAFRRSVEMSELAEK